MHHRSHDRGEGVSVQGEGVSVQRGGGSLSRMVSVGGGVSVQGVSVKETPPYGNERAVRILLECILVLRLLIQVDELM